jgi:AraC-like DNA-binding protein
MIFQEVKPCPQLQDLVKNYLLVNLSSESGVLPIKPYPARIEEALVFFARGHIDSIDPVSNTITKINSNAIFGQQTSRLDFRSVGDRDFLMLMVIFQPGGLNRLLRIPAYELTTQYCDAGAFINDELTQTNDAIANSTSYAEMITRANQFLLQKASTLKQDRNHIDAIAALLLDNPMPFSLDYLATQANLSSRQLERKFNERIGIGPKLYSRISRFYKAFDFKQRNIDTDWLTIAIEFGYTDYYHLCKDFKEFGNVTPNILLHQYEQRPERLVAEFMKNSASTY